MGKTKVKVVTAEELRKREEAKVGYQEFFRLQAEAEKIVQEKLARGEISAKDINTKHAIVWQYIRQHAQTPFLRIKINLPPLPPPIITKSASTKSLPPTQPAVQVQTVPSAQYNAQELNNIIAIIIIKKQIRFGEGSLG